LISAAGRLAVIAAGGTGGHLFPAQALAEALIRREWRIILATDERTRDMARDFPAEDRLAIASATLAGGPAQRAGALAQLARGVLAARAALSRLQPAITVGFGGYPSLPTLVAAIALGRRTLIHEQNAVLGRANRLLAGRVTAVGCAFPTLMKASPRVQARATVVGNPVRPEIRALFDRPYAPPTAEGPLRLLITGGSQGARLLSEGVPAAVARLPEAIRQRLEVQQQTRAESLEAAGQIYREAGVRAETAPFFRDMAGRLAGAHLVIGRAGASTCGELAVAGRPSILVPLKIALDDDQGQNARLLAEAGGTCILREDAVTPEVLSTLLLELLDDPARLAAMSSAARAVAKPDAAERLADLAERTAG
jgi:UDP-N-acetylglucosamine--N-acetylmuramyl-(pentapeptide) pyrophosphoryl-undecaprenol N-acetylglucosamine transferase